MSTRSSNSLVPIGKKKKSDPKDKSKLLFQAQFVPKVLQDYEQYLNQESEVAQLDLSVFKTEQCLDRKDHDREQCPFWHNKKTDKRRADVDYSAELCHWALIKKVNKCENGDECKFAHTLAEDHFH